jgi:hypothetical protein
MKHLISYNKLFEAFESKNISGTLHFIKNPEERKKFINSLKEKKGPEKCGAESKWIKGEFCQDGKVKRTWGKGTRMSTCPVCKGTGVKKPKPNDLKIIKFWFNSEGRFVSTTGVDGTLRNSINNSNKLDDNPKHYKEGEKITLEQFFKLPTGSIIMCDFRTIPSVISYVLQSNRNPNREIFLLQNKISGSTPDYSTSDWKKIAKFSYVVVGPQQIVNTSIKLLIPKADKAKKMTHSLGMYL